ncbi:alpha/beta fold hydrolase [Devosia sp. 1566]|uniref:thioesterase domain-containing protein n=1 Tax=Devosia sp. 1566 TaxID=2499144 RepID=UPI0013E3F0C9|nr:alpha/beta fold hydrolase [Devosia sp. 1566]
MHGLLCDPGFASILGRALPHDQPVYTFQPVGIDGAEEPLLTIEEIAQHYVNAARNVVADRPFCIAGYCAGGLIALEMAHQFTAIGLAPQRLFILDLARLPDTPRAMQLAEAYEANQISTVHRHMRDNEFLAQNWSGWPATVRATIRAARSYHIRPYAGSTCIFSSKQMLPLVRSSLSGFQGLVPEDTPIIVSGATRDDLLAGGMAKIGRVMAGTV